MRSLRILMTLIAVGVLCMVSLGWSFEDSGYRSWVQENPQAPFCSIDVPVYPPVQTYHVGDTLWQQSDHRLIIEKFQQSQMFYQVRHFSQNTNNGVVAEYLYQPAGGPMMPLYTKVSFFLLDLTPAPGTNAQLGTMGGFAVNAYSAWHIVPNGTWYAEAEDSNPFNVEQ